MKQVISVTLNTHRSEPVDPQKVRKLAPGGGWDTRYARRTLLEQDLEDVVEVVIDVDAIALLVGRRAVDAENGRATAMHGLVKARRTHRKILSARRLQIPLPPGSEAIPDGEREDPHADLGYGR